MKLRNIALLLMFAPLWCSAQTATVTLDDAVTVQAAPAKPGINISTLNFFDTGNSILKNFVGNNSWSFNQIGSRQIKTLTAAGTSTVFTDPDIFNQPFQNYWAGGTIFVEVSQSGGAELNCTSAIASNLGQTQIISGSISGSVATFVTDIASGFTPGQQFYVKNSSNSSYNQFGNGTVTSVSGTTTIVTYTGTLPTGTTTGGYVGQIGDNTFTLSTPCAAPLTTGDVIVITQPARPVPAAQWAANFGGVWAYPTGLSSDTTDLCATCGDQALDMNGLSTPTYTFSYFDASDTNINLFTLLSSGSYNFSFDAKLVSGSTTGLNAKIVRGTDSGPGVNCSFTPTMTTGVWAHYSATCTPAEIGIVQNISTCKPGGPFTGCTVPNTEVTVTVEANGSEVYFDNLNFSSAADTNPTQFSQTFITALQSLHPGTLRMWSNQNAQTIENWTRPTSSQDLYGTAGDWGAINGSADVVPSLEDFLQLNQMVGSNPYIEVPVTFSPTEMSQMIDFLCGGSGTTYGARRIALGQTTPWCQVFSHIYLTVCNECWNGNFANQNLPLRGGEPSGADEYYDYGKVNGLLIAAARATGSYSTVIQFGFDVQTAVTANATSIGFAHPDFLEMEGYWMNNMNQWTNTCGLTTPPATLESCTWLPGFAELYTVAHGPALDISTHTGDPTNFFGSDQTYLGLNICGPSGTAACQVSVYEEGPGTLGSNDGVESPQAYLDQLNAGAGQAAYTVISLAEKMKQYNIVQNFFAATGYNNGGNNGNTFKGWGCFVDIGGATGNLRPECNGLMMLNAAMIGPLAQSTITGTGTTISTPYLDYAGVGPGTGSGENKGVSIVPALPLNYSYLFTNGSQRSLLLVSGDTTNTWTMNLAGTNVPTGSVALQDFNPSTCASPPAGWGQLDCMNETYTGGGSTFETASTVAKVASTIAAPGSVTLTPGEMKLLTWNVSGTPTAATPTFAPPAGTYTSAQSVAITASTGSVICVSTTTTPATNGTTGCTTGTLYTGPITVSASETINAVAGGTGFLDSAVGSATYTITAPALPATPTFSPAAGSFSSPQTVSMVTTTLGCNSHVVWNLTGATVGGNLTGTTAGNTVSVPSSETVYAQVQGCPSFANSLIGSAAYTISTLLAAPSLSPPAGTYSGAQSVTISDSAGATICYGLGTVPIAPTPGICGPGSTTYTGPIMVSMTQVIRALATQAGHVNSVVTTAAYTINSTSILTIFLDGKLVFSGAVQTP